VVQQKRVLTSAPSGAEELRTLIDGEVLLPGDEGYARETAGWNLLVEHNPSLVVVPFTPEDVAMAVRFAAAESLPVAVQATGHGPSLPAEGCVLISTRRMTSLGIDVSAGPLVSAPESSGNRSSNKRVATVWVRWWGPRPTSARSAI
jgi:hypothetical protein